MQPEKMQTELDKVVTALGDFYAREAICSRTISANVP